MELSSLVLWKDKADSVIVESNVTAAEPYKLLRFTVFDVRSQRPAVTDEDGITYQLTATGDKTRLHVRQGDFAVMPDGAKYRDMSVYRHLEASPASRESRRRGDEVEGATRRVY